VEALFLCDAMYNRVRDDAPFRLLRCHEGIPGPRMKTECRLPKVAFEPRAKMTQSLVASVRERLRPSAFKVSEIAGPHDRISDNHQRGL
jgi:hypothetical protein